MQIIIVILLLTISLSSQAQVIQSAGYPIIPVPFTSVKVTDAFWGQRLKASREETIPLAFSKCEETDVYKTIEGAIAHYQATGKRNFPDIAIKYADCAVREIGDKPGQVAVVPGHQIAGMALAKLYVLTGQKKYIDLAKFLLDKRGYTGHKDEYNQSHKPVLQ